MDMAKDSNTREEIMKMASERGYAEGLMLCDNYNKDVKAYAYKNAFMEGFERACEERCPELMDRKMQTKEDVLNGAWNLGFTTGGIYLREYNNFIRWVDFLNHFVLGVKLANHVWGNDESIERTVTNA